MIAVKEVAVIAPSFPGSSPTRPLEREREPRLAVIVTFIDSLTVNNPTVNKSTKHGRLYAQLCLILQAPRDIHGLTYTYTLIRYSVHKIFAPLHT